MAYEPFDSNHGYEVSAPGFAERTARGLRKFGHAVASLPVIGWFTGLTIAPASTAVAAVLESGSSVSDGHYSKAFKQVVSGTVDTAVTAATGAFWWANAAIALGGGVAGFGMESLAERARKLTNWGLDSADDMTGRHARAAENAKLTQIARMQQVLSAQPRTNGVATAGVAYAPAVQEQLTQAAPTNTQFTDRVAQARGQSPDEARAAFMRDGENAAHVAALNASRENTQQQENTV